MTLDYATPSTSRGGMFYIGWVLSLLPSLFIITMVVTMALFKPEMIQESMGKYGFPPSSGKWIIAVEMVCLALYLFPPTAVLGGLLLLGYLGGAVATHVRAGEPPMMPILFGIIFWLGLYFRDARIRALIPWRQTSKPMPPALSI